MLQVGDYHCATPAEPDDVAEGLLRNRANPKRTAMAEEEHQQSPNRPTRDTAQLQTQSDDDDDDDGDFMPPLSSSHILRRIQRKRDNITRHVSNATQSQREENGRVGTPSGRSNTLSQR